MHRLDDQVPISALSVNDTVTSAAIESDDPQAFDTRTQKFAVLVRGVVV